MKGEYDKAEVYYAKLYKKNNTTTFYNRYFNCLMFQEKYDESEKLAKKQLRKDPYTNDNHFKLAQVYEKTDRQDDADAIYQGLIDDLPAIQGRIKTLGNDFKNKGKYNWALATFEHGKSLTKNGYQFQLELAELYTLTNQPELMIAEYLNLLEYSPTYLRTVQNYLSRAIDFEEDIETVNLLREELLVRIQDMPDAHHYSEMLIWYYMHTQEYMGAVIQAKALDKKKKNNGERVYKIGNELATNGAYDEAIKAYIYVEEIGEKSPYFFQATGQKLNLMFLTVINSPGYDKAQIREVANAFETVISERGKNAQTVYMMVQLAEIYGFYLDETMRAENLVSECMALSNNRREIAKYKILLGDIYVVSGKIWEASLLYMQVEKDYSEEPIGHMAKFKNAKVFYYDGEFDYAKAQLDILKASTTKLIANDAMQLSLLLQDNLGIDTTQAPVKMFAATDLLVQQHKYDEALQMLDSLDKSYPFHSINDEVLFKKGEIYEHLQNYDKAIEYYQTVIDAYSHDILADDAAFRIAKIYDYKLNDKAKANEYYRLIMFEFGSSLYTAESRERFNFIQKNFDLQEKFDKGINQ